MTPDLAYTAKLNTPYGHEPHEATGFTLEIKSPGYPAAVGVTTQIPMAVAADLLRQLATGFKEYRDASNAHFGATLETAMKEATAIFE